MTHGSFGLNKALNRIPSVTLSSHQSKKSQADLFSSCFSDKITKICDGLWRFLIMTCFSFLLITLLSYFFGDIWIWSSETNFQLSIQIMPTRSMDYISGKRLPWYFATFYYQSLRRLHFHPITSWVIVLCQDLASCQNLSRRHCKSSFLNLFICIWSMCLSLLTKVVIQLRQCCYW